MNHRSIGDEALTALIIWFDEYRPSDGVQPAPYIICAGLAVLERMRRSFPLSDDDYVTSRNQLRTSGSLIRSILARNSEHRRFLAEGGRTTRGAVTAARNLVDRLHGTAGFVELSGETRIAVIDRMQVWLVHQVALFFDRRKISIEVDLDKPAPQIVAGVLEAAGVNAGAVAQHMVGAKLALRFPDNEVENYSVTTADQQLGRPGDFLVGDTAIHVTVSPTMLVFEKCADNVRDGYRTLLLVPDSRLLAARQMADGVDTKDRVGIMAIESFVGQNIEELGGFVKDSLANNLVELFTKYNERVADVESDRSLQISVPVNL